MMKKHVAANVSWIGYLDYELKQFHGSEYSLHHGSSQNAYLIEEGKTVLMDTVWMPHEFDFLANLKEVMHGDLHKIDYIVANHGEVDHSGSLPLLMQEIPDTPIYCTAAAVQSLEGQYGKLGWNFHVVKTGDELDIGNGKKLVFIEMRMLHWPDSMATFLTGDNILFSMDAFGQHYCCPEMFNDRADQNVMWDEALKYYVNIVNPFAPVLKTKLAELKKMNLPVSMICPSHGVIWRDNPMQIVEAYEKWCSADNREDQVVIAYDTMWNGTEKIAHAIAEEIGRQSPSTRILVYNIADSDKNDVVAEIFKARAVAVGSPTEINDVLSSVSGWLTYVKSMKFKNKRGGAFGCYGWGGGASKVIQNRLTEAGFTVIPETVDANWNPKEEDLAKVPAFVQDLLNDGYKA